MERKQERHGSRHSFEQGIGDFGEEVGSLGERFGNRAEGFGREVENRWNSAFGFFGPLVSSIFAAIVFVFAIWALGFLAAQVESSFLLKIRGFFLENIAVFFALFLFFNYAEYCERAYRKAYAPFSPLVKAAGIAAAIWVIASIMLLLSASFGYIPIKPVAEYAIEKLFWLFVFFAMLGYLALLVFGKEGKRPTREEFAMAKAKREEAEPIKRIYRSGKDKILGGVCGGIAEYLKVDPVIIRLLWVAACFVWGFGILLYIICWIIIPRNPAHKWN